MILPLNKKIDDYMYRVAQKSGYRKKMMSYIFHFENFIKKNKSKINNQSMNISFPLEIDLIKYTFYRIIRK